MQDRVNQEIKIPASKLIVPTTTGTHTGMDEGHLGTGLDVLGVVVVPVVGATVVTEGLWRLLILVKMKGCAYRKDKMRFTEFNDILYHM